MVFHCEYCGASIDSEIDKNCPVCGASYAKNKSFKELKQKEEIRKKLEQEEKQARIEKQKIQNEYNKTKVRNYQRNEQTKKNSRTVLIILFVFLAPILFSFIATGFFLFSGGLAYLVSSSEVVNENNYNYEDIYDFEDRISEESTPAFIFNEVAGGFNEAVNNGTLSVMINELKEVDDYPFKPDNGYMYVVMHFVVENVSQLDYDDNSSIYCNADGMLMDSHWLSDYRKLDAKKIPAGMKIDGYLCFEVPVNVENLEITYGDYITISIPGENIIKLAETN